MAASKPILLLSFHILFVILCFAYVGLVAISSNNSDVIAQMYNRRKLLRINSLPVNASIRAILILNSFAENGDGRGVSECDEQFHENTEMIVALSTSWYAGGAMCAREIKISLGRQNAVAKVVAECDSRRGCDNKTVDASHAAWRALGLNEDHGKVAITWSMA